MNARSRSWTAVLILLAALLSANVFYSRPAQAHSDVDINIFFDALAPYGTWVDHNAYGRVWYPRGVAAGWRPYTDGRWAFNDRYGWVWVSDWVWGWAPFHYGRWAWDDWYGWVWVPGRVWAPAWVFWRYGGGYAAWAPMPPNAYWQPGYGLNTRHFDYDRDLRRDWWVSVPDRHLHDRYMRRHLIDPRHNHRVLNVTNNFVNVTNVNNVIINHGVPVRQIEKRIGRKVRSIPIRAVERPQDRKIRRSQDGLTVIRPKLTPPDADDIRRQEDLARRISVQNEQQRRNQGRPDRQRADDRPATPLPGRLRKGAPDSPPKGSQTIMPSFDAQPGGRPVQPPDVDAKPQRDRRGEGRPEQPRQLEERRRQEEPTPHAGDETLRQRQLQEREEQQRQQQQQQRQLEERRRQQEQPDRARDEAVWRQKVQEREAQQQRQRQLEEQRRQTEQAERAREEAIRQRQLRQREEQQRQQQMREREEQLHQQQLQQRQLEERRRQAERADRARENAIRQREMQQRQFEEQRRQQLQQQRQFEEQRRRQEIEQQQQINMQRQREMQQRQMEIPRQQNEQRRRQEIDNAQQQRRQQQLQQQQMQRQDNRYGYPGAGR